MNLLIAEPTVAPEEIVLCTEARIPVATEYIGVAAFFTLCGAIAVRLWNSAGAELWWAAPLMAMAGFVTADLLSGVVHWAFDTWGATTTPVLGKTFIRPFRIHHADPNEITIHGFVATNGHNCLSASPFLALALLLPMHAAWGRAGALFLLALCLAVFGTNQFHKWAHSKEVHPVARAAQRWGIILSPEHHAVHHVSPYTGQYCITTGWMNPVLARIKFFRRAELVIVATTGAVPRLDDLGKKNQET